MEKEMGAAASKDGGSEAQPSAVLKMGLLGGYSGLIAVNYIFGKGLLGVPTNSELSHKWPRYQESNTPNLNLVSIPRRYLLASLPMSSSPMQAPSSISGRISDEVRLQFDHSSRVCIRHLGHHLLAARWSRHAEPLADQEGNLEGTGCVFGGASVDDDLGLRKCLAAVLCADGECGDDRQYGKTALRVCSMRSAALGRVSLGPAWVPAPARCRKGGGGRDLGRGIQAGHEHERRLAVGRVLHRVRPHCPEHLWRNLVDPLGSPHSLCSRGSRRRCCCCFKLGSWVHRAGVRWCRRMGTSGRQVWSKCARGCEECGAHRARHRRWCMRLLHPLWGRSQEGRLIFNGHSPTAP